MNNYIHTLAITLFLTCGTVLHGSEGTTPDDQEKARCIAKIQRHGPLFSRTYTEFFQSKDDGDTHLRAMALLAVKNPKVLGFQLYDPVTGLTADPVMQLAQRIRNEKQPSSKLLDAFSHILEYEKSNIRKVQTLINVGIKQLCIPVVDGLLLDKRTDITNRPEVLVAMTDRCQEFCEKEAKSLEEGIVAQRKNAIFDIAVSLIFSNPSAQGLVGRTPHDTDCLSCSYIFSHAADELEQETELESPVLRKLEISTNTRPKIGKDFSEESIDEQEEA